MYVLYKSDSTESSNPEERTGSRVMGDGAVPGPGRWFPSPSSCTDGVVVGIESYYYKLGLCTLVSSCLPLRRLALHKLSLSLEAIIC